MIRDPKLGLLPSVATLVALGTLGSSLVASDAHAYDRGYRVAILAAAPVSPSPPAVEPLPYQADVRDKIMIATRGLGGNHVMPTGRAAVEIARLDLFDLSTSTPDLNELEDYDAAFVFVDDAVSFADPVAAGDLIAGLIEQGVGVTLAGDALASGKGPQGRFFTQDFAPVVYGSPSVDATLFVAPLDPADLWLPGPNVGALPFWGVLGTSLGGGQHVSGLSAVPEAEVLAELADTTNFTGDPAVVLLEPAISGHGRVAALNFNPVSSDADPDGWQPGFAQLDKMMGNTILWTVGFERRIGTCVELSPSGAVPQFEVDDELERFYRQGMVDPDFVDTDKIDSTSNLPWIAPTLPLRCNVVDDCLPASHPSNVVVCQTCENLDIFQDLNCNGDSVEDEPLIDNSSPECQANVDASGNPYDNNDYYFDYFRFECEYVTDDMDDDGDLLSSGTVQVFYPGDLNPDETYQLSCDNCPGYFNPNQYDSDCIAYYSQGEAFLGFAMQKAPDGAGDLCDPAPYVETAIQSWQGDIDGDGIADVMDNCVLVPNTDQYDDDSDGFGNVCDTCPVDWNPIVTVLDIDGDMVPDLVAGAPREGEIPFDPLLDAVMVPPEPFLLIAGLNGTQPDKDRDGVGDRCDNCALHPRYGDWYPKADPPHYDEANSDQIDSDGDGWGDACDGCDTVFDPRQPDQDSDFVTDACDNCPNFPAFDITDQDGDGLGDACDNCDQLRNLDQIDSDADGLGDACDNCPFFGNEGQEDSDGDGLGDVCDNCPLAFNPDQEDADGDGFADACDNCVNTFQVQQSDIDFDGVGDSCDLCPQIADPENLDSDGDGVGDVCDNCKDVRNPDQADDDGDGLGNTCDVYAIRGGGDLAPKEPGNGCSTAGGQGVGALWLGALALGWRRRRA